MKKNRLLEIIREEIAGTLNEKTALGAGALNDPDFKKAFSKLPGDEKAKVTKGLQSGTETFVFEEEQLNEIEQLAEMASMIQLKNQLAKQGKDDELKAVVDAEKTTIDKLKQNPVFSGEGKNARLKGYVSALKKELKANHDINLQDLLTVVMLDAEAAGDKFKDDISTNTIEKDAAAQVLGTEKGVRGRKADPNKKEKAPSTGTKGRPAGTKKATLTPGDDGFDKVTYDAPTKDSDEDKAAAAAAKGDKSVSSSGKYAKKLSAEEEDLFKTYKKQAVTLANKIEDAESAAEKQKLTAQLKSLRNTPEVAALFKAKGVNI
jgi:hypothetical protein